MAKANSKKLIPISTLASLSVIAVIVSFLIGYKVGSNKASGSISDINKNGEGTESTIVGTYNRSFSNNYNNRMESYIVLKGDGSCKYISAIKSESASTVDLDTMDERCSYIYDENAKAGIITIKNYYIENGQKIDDSGKLKFSFEPGALMLGGALYSKLK